MSETSHADPKPRKMSIAKVRSKKRTGKATAKRKKLEPIETFHCTDAGNAELLAQLYGDSLRYDHKQGRWLIWNNARHRWSEDKQGAVYILAKRAARFRAKAAANIDDEKRSEMT